MLAACVNTIVFKKQKGKIMTENVYKTNICGAETFRRLSNGSENHFWDGYLRGR